MRGTLKSIADKFGAAVKNKATEAINEGSSFVSKNAESAYKTGKSAAMETARTASKGASGSFDRFYKQGKDATLSQVTAATTKASHVVRDASSSFASSARDASVSMASSAKEAAKEAAVEAKIEAKRGIRWLLVWSLAAVGVYGVATTVSKELVRHALVGTKREDHMIENKQSKQSRERGAPENSGRWSWLSLSEQKPPEQSSEGDASGSGGRWSWATWGGRPS
ncbi:unnamed protein product [Cylindrotheca closterium]|uniref:Uncharacterized protein n=1 Tax=Cylindrotheca closterium TaxID=2856 RepID=A0AAD2CGX4_9STRA|nr:unnamed protein product [Cylindrotheca closterium]